MQNKQDLLDAANILLRSPEAESLYKTLRSVTALPPNLPIKLSGGYIDLNPLLTLFRHDPTKFGTLMDHVDTRREQLGVPRLQCEPVEVKFDKTDYQRDLMAERRRRQTRAAELENMKRPASEQLVGHAREDFMRMQQKRWTVRLEATLDTVRLGKTMTKEARQQISARFWDTVDRETDESELTVTRWVQDGRKGTCP
jgi:hypothetical protein